jgi:hypothetical protein
MEKPADVLKKLGVTGILTLPPEEGGASQLLCDTDECYCPRGRGYFDPISQDDQGAWIPTEEHWPIGQAERGPRVKGNIWLAHKLCNFLAGAEEERKRALTRKQEWALANPQAYQSDFGNREAADAWWRQHSSRRQAHPDRAAPLPVDE